MDFLSGCPWPFWIKKEEVAMPTSRRKGVPGRSSLPADFVHNPLAAAAANPLLNLLGLCQQPLSLGNLQAPGHLALTYPGSNRGPASSKAPESLKSASASAWDCLNQLLLASACVCVIYFLLAGHAHMSHEWVGTWLAKTSTMGLIES